MMKSLSWKNLKSNVKLVSLAIVVLMALQMVTVLLVSHNRKVERFRSQASETFSNCVVSMEEMLDYMKETTLSAAAEHDIYYMLFSESISREDMQRFRSAAGKVQAGMFMKVKELFVYNDLNGVVYTRGMQAVKLEKLPETATKSAVMRDVTRGDKLIMFTDGEDFITHREYEAEGDVLRFIYFPSRQSNSCLMLDVDIKQITDLFDAYQEVFSSEIFIVGENEEFFYGSNERLQESLKSDMPQLLRQNFNEPVFRKYDGKYLALNYYSTKSKLRMLSLIPDTAIKVDYQETRTLLFTNLSLVVAVCIALILIFVLKAFNDAAIENGRHQVEKEEERLHNQFMRKKQHLANCLFRPSEQDIRMAKEYVDALLLDLDGNPGEITSWSSVVIMRIEICDYAAFRELHSSRDILLYKYGIVNICEEILNNHVKALSIYERDNEIVFLIIPCEDFADKCRQAFEECRAAVKSYIGEELSAFLSNEGKIEELSELNSQTLRLSEYQFLLGGSVFLGAEFLDSRSSVNAQEMMDRLEQLCSALEQHEGEKVLSETFGWLREMHLEDAKNVLWMFMFRLYNIGKKNARSIESIESLVSKFNDIQKLEEMTAFFGELSESVFPKEQENAKKRRNHIVSKVQEIIENSFTEPEFCSDTVAEEMNLSKAYLSRKYRQETGVSISETINERRLEEFARELLVTDKSVKAIIDDIGGVNHNYYMIMFKKKFSMTPTEYRQEFKRI